MSLQCFLNNYSFFSRAVLLVLRARMFKTSDLNIVKKILTYCYLGDWWVLYQLGRNSNTHFFRYLLRHIEHDFALKEKRALREERRRHRRPPGNKGQKISKGNFDVLISPKIQTRGLVSTGAMASLAPVILRNKLFRTCNFGTI